MSDDVNVSDPRVRANMMKVNELKDVCMYATVTIGSAPVLSPNVPEPAVLRQDEKALRSTVVDNDLPKRPCSV